MVALLWGCALDPEVVAKGFSVVGSAPAHGEQDVIEAVVPELRFSSAADAEACAQATRLDAVDADGAVLFAVEVVALWASSDEKLQLTHDVPLRLGYDYALTVRGAASEADTGCTSVSGEIVAPFFARFRVPEASE